MEVFADPQVKFKEINNFIDSPQAYSTVCFVSICCFILSLIQYPLNKSAKRAPHVLMAYTGALFTMYLIYLLIFCTDKALDYSFDLKYFRLTPTVLLGLLILFSMNCCRVASLDGFELSSAITTENGI